MRRLEAILTEIGIVSITRTLDRYPSGLELLRFLRAHAPQVIFVSTESTAKAMEIAREVEKNTPGVQIVAVSRFVDPQILLEVMRAGYSRVCVAAVRSPGAGGRLSRGSRTRFRRGRRPLKPPIRFTASCRPRRAWEHPRWR
jgi:DNA-binding NarL/FixJ family response regulator